MLPGAAGGGSAGVGAGVAAAQQAVSGRAGSTRDQVMCCACGGSEGRQDRPGSSALRAACRAGWRRMDAPGAGGGSSLWYWLPAPGLYIVL